MASRLDPAAWGPPVGLLALGAVVGLLAGYDPLYGLAAALAIAFVALILIDLQAGLCVFAVAAFLDVLPAGGTALTFTKGLGLLLLVSWLAALATRPGEENDFLRDHPAFTYLLIAFLGWGLASLLWAESPAVGLDALSRYALNIVLFLIVYTAVRDRQGVTWVIAAFMLGGLISAAYGVLAPQSPGAELDVARLAGAGGDPNEVAALLVATLVLAAAFAAGMRQQPLVRVAALGVLGFCALGIVLSFSRGGLVALAVALATAVLFSGRWRPAALALLVAVVGFAVTYVAVVATPLERARVTTIDGGTGRSDIWEIGWRMFESSPAVGIGVGNFAVSSIHFLLEPGALQRDEFIVDEPKVAHNVYLEIATELGVVGFLMFICVIGFSLLSALRAAHSFTRSGDERMELLARAVAVAVVSLLAANFFVSDQFSKQLWLLLALGPTLLRIARTEEEDDSEEHALYGGQDTLEEADA